MHHCSSKSDLMTAILEKVKASKEVVDTISEENSAVIVDAMAEVQCLEKSNDVVNCADLADAFIHKLIHKYGPDKYKTLYLVFDRYDT